ncbi:MAG: ABC transporter ATP-binding protein [Corynebacterium sp.]|uniref:energy-coupling factor ABC transporter ATP-binding protein n=1 Tax=Corynebacterium sp. TaxID=1720 RepID=UPI0026DAEBBD|nr:ABC transporter ATP-binding protein [Corynebacterium sp.]MDO4761003.1 ABC transporter ATP-binding protein [Corynebacterium sp.]
MDTHSNDPIISAHNLAFSRDGVPVFIDVSLDIRPGMRIALLGRNGAGKSTLFRLIAGAWKPTSGLLTLDGQPYSYSRQGRDVIRNSVQMVLQEPDDQIFATTVAADVSFGPINQGLSPDEVADRVSQALEQCEISKLADRVPHQLSFGQRKRVALAGALAMQPRVLLLDEPTAGLDPHGCARVADILLGLSHSGTAIVCATHDVNFAYEIADSVAVLIDGHLHSGAPDTVLADEKLMTHASLCLPWAPVVSEVLGRTITRISDLRPG